MIRTAPLLISLCVFPKVALAADFELLSNGGFEAGSLNGWIQSVGPNEGHVVSVSGPTAQACARIAPNLPRSGSFLFSSSTQDGATPNTPEITISQVLDVSGFTGVAGGGASMAATGFFSGAAGCTSTSDDTAQLSIAFYSGGPSGSLLATIASSPIDPAGGVWNVINVNGAVPQSTDTIVLSVTTRLDPGFASIDIGVDDVSLVLTVPEVVPILNPFALGVLAASLVSVGCCSLSRRAA